MTDAVSIVNRSLELIGNQQTITSLSDGSIPANAANVMYQAAVTLVMRDSDPAFARRVVAAVTAAAPAPVPPWAYEWLYPSDCIRLRQVRPQTGSYNTNDPQPIRAQVGFDVIGSVNTKVVLTNINNPLLAYSSSTPNENQWDPGFAEAVSRRLANPLSMALAGRPDFARELLEESERYTSMAESLDDL